jgi:diguanylate cyclase (GGDEF)-like protein/PAS domain S-box-containing protein
VQDKEEGLPIEVRLSTATGWKLVELVGAPMPWVEDGAIVLVLRDLTDRRRFELVHDQDARFRSIVQNSAAVTMLISPDGIVESSSGALTRLLGHDPEIIVGGPLAAIVSQSDHQALAAAFGCASRGASVASPEIVTLNLRRSGSGGTVPFELAIVNLIDDPTVGGFVVSGRDMTDRKRLEERLTHQAFHDSLTGLGNRSLFLDGLEDAVARTKRTHGQLAVLFLDVDNFKAINDSLGHSVGDALLQSLGKILLRCLRKADTAARLGGDEFGVMIEEFANPNEVIRVAERILDAVRQPTMLGNVRVSATVSVGVAFHKSAMSSSQLLSDADIAMYSAKERGKDQIAELEEQPFGGLAGAGNLIRGLGQRVRTPG